MKTVLLTLALAGLAAGDDPKATDKPRKPHPLAPSIPALTKDEEDQLDDLLDRFMKADTGQLRGEDAKTAIREFDKLGPEAIPALIRGLNRAAQIEHSCPTLTITRKLSRMLLASDDQELLEFARDNIGAGVERSVHMRALQDLRFQVLMRKNALARRGDTGPKNPRAMTVTELATAAGKERGARLKQVLTELETRRGPEVLATLSAATTSLESDIRELSRDLIERHLGRQPASVVKEKLKDEQTEVVRAAMRVVVGKMPSLGGELIDLLADERTDVREAAHAALVSLAKGEDFGPASGADREERGQAQKKWRAWWEKQKSR
jgi:hypothetical protein